jgi:hypothetical protein
MVSPDTRNPGLAVLILVSAVRDDLPWLYEMGVQVYRLSLAGETPALRRACVSFVRAAEVALMGPFYREFRNSKETHMLMEDLSMMLHRFRLDGDEGPESDEHVPSPELKETGSSR